MSSLIVLLVIITLSLQSLLVIQVDAKHASATRIFRENKSLTKGACEANKCKVQSAKRVSAPRSVSKEMNLSKKVDVVSEKDLTENEDETLWEDWSDYDMPYAMDYVVGVTVEKEDGSREDYDCIMDTGSSNLGISTDTCADCGTGVGKSDLRIPYDEDECIEVLYGDSTEDSTYWSGYETISTKVGFSAKNDKSVDLMTATTFAAITNASTGDKEFFDGGYTGILGLAYSGIAESYYDCDSGTSNLDATPLIDSLKDDGVIDDDIFTISYCGESAELAVGSLDESTYTGDMQYTPAKETFGEYYGYYLAAMEDFEIDGDSLDVSADLYNTYGGAVVDSGTTELILPVSAYVAMAKLILEKVTWLDSSFFSDEECITSAGLDGMPDMTIKMEGGVSLTLSAKNYLILYDDCYYWGASASTMTIIGNVAMQGLTVAFDRENSRIGFADISSDLCGDSGALSAASSDNVDVNVNVGEEKTEEIENSNSEIKKRASQTMKIYGPKPRALAKRWPSLKKEAHAQLLMELGEQATASTTTINSQTSSSPFDMNAVGIFAIIGSLSVFGAFAIVYNRFRTYGSYERVDDFRI